MSPPAYVERQLGALPDTEYGQSCWLAAARVIERYRTEHDIADPTTPFGAEPSAPDAAGEWRAASDLLRYYRSGLTSTRGPNTRSRPSCPSESNADA